MGKCKRILVLVHPQFRPDRRSATPGSATEFDVWTALRGLKHHVEIAAAEQDLRRFDRQLAEFRPDIVFNLLEEFRGEGVYDFHLVTFLESLGIPYTGCNPRGLIVSRNKLWTSYIARGQGLPAPNTELVGRSLRVSRFPAFVKFNREHASLGVTRDNVVRDRTQLRRSLARMKDTFPGEVVFQDFVAGQEVTVSLWGNRRVETFQPWRLGLRDADDVATQRVKFSAKYRRQRGIQAHPARLDTAAEKRLLGAAKTLYGLFDLSGYARLDFRIDGEGTAFLIDVNANPNLAKGEDFAASAMRAGYSYSDVVDRVLRFGLEYAPRV